MAFVESRLHEVDISVAQRSIQHQHQNHAQLMFHQKNRPVTNLQVQSGYIVVPRQDDSTHRYRLVEVFLSFAIFEGLASLISLRI